MLKIRFLETSLKASNWLYLRSDLKQANGKAVVKITNPGNY